MMSPIRSVMRLSWLVLEIRQISLLRFFAVCRVKVQTTEEGAQGAAVIDEPLRALYLLRSTASCCCCSIPDKHKYLAAQGNLDGDRDHLGQQTAVEGHHEGHRVVVREHQGNLRRRRRENDNMREKKVYLKVQVYWQNLNIRLMNIHLPLVSVSGCQNQLHYSNRIQIISKMRTFNGGNCCMEWNYCQNSTNTFFCYC